jgi:hypothetical protein
MPRVTDVERAHTLALNLDAQRAARGSLAALDMERGVLHAHQLRALAELGRLSAEKPAHAALEVAGTLGVGQGRATTLLDHGRRAVQLYPRALELMEAGALRPATLELLLYVTAKATEEVQAELGHRVIDALVGCDAVDARALIVATLLEVEADLDLEAHKERHEKARANRGVWVKQVEDGMARIGAEVDAMSAQRFQLDLDALCRLHKRSDEQAGIERRAEQRRADVLADLPTRHLALLRALQQGKSAADLLASGPEDVLAGLCAVPVPKPCVMYVHTPMTTVLDLDNRSGWVERLGPISAHQSRLLRPTAALQALWVDAGTGIPLGIDAKAEPPVGEPDWDDPDQVRATAQLVRERLRSMLRPAAVTHEVEPRRFPSRALARLVQVRDVQCTGVGCSMPASRCEIDHLVPVSEGGETAYRTLALKSPRCHHARHDGWVAERNEGDGSTTWFSPAGGEYERRSPWRPPPPVRGSLPPPRLDRPDGGRPRAFGTDVESELEPEAEPEVPPPPRRDGRKTFLDLARERRELKRDEPLSEVTPWGRPWHTDGPPPI